MPTLAHPEPRKSPSTISERFEDAAALRAEAARLSEHVGAIRVETAAAKIRLEALKRACAQSFTHPTATLGRPPS